MTLKQPKPLPLATQEYIRNNFSGMSIEKLAADTGATVTEVSEMVKELCETLNLNKSTLVSLTISAEVDKDDLTIFWALSENCTLEILFNFIKSIRDGSINLDILESLDTRLQDSGGRIKMLVDELFPQGIVGTQPVVDPVLALGEHHHHD